MIVYVVLYTTGSGSLERTSALKLKDLTPRPCLVRFRRLIAQIEASRQGARYARGVVAIFFLAICEKRVEVVRDGIILVRKSRKIKKCTQRHHVHTVRLDESFNLSYYVLTVGNGQGTAEELDP